MTRQLALLGGAPVRLSFTAWPVFGKTDETRLRALRGGKWGRLIGEVASSNGVSCDARLPAGIATVQRAPALALLAAGLRRDKVIVPPYTFFSTPGRD
jgi:hypothetical protein